MRDSIYFGLFCGLVVLVYELCRLAITWATKSWRKDEKAYQRLADMMKPVRYSPAYLGRAPVWTAPPTFDVLVDKIAHWQRQTFPDGTPESCAAHLLKEAKELDKAPRDWQEIADVMHLVIAVADRNCIDLKLALARKFEINRNRQWGSPDDQGIVEHIVDRKVAPCP